jgi:hypothetical protein
MHGPTLSPEAQLLLLTAGGPRNDERIRELLAREGGLDWDKLSWLAQRERAAPVLWDRLQAIGAGPLPPQAGQLQRLAMVSEFRMLHLEQRLRESLDALAQARIDAMLLKGAALAVTMYGSFLRRPMLDLDILVRPGEAERARAVLLGAGWVTSSMEAREEFYEGHHHLPALKDAGGTGVQLEVHKGLFFTGHPFRLSPDDLWQRASRVVIGRPGAGRGARGLAAYVPSTHDQLLHVCLHFGWSHMMSTGAWRAFRDLETLLASGKVQWSEFIRLAQESRGATCCYWTFRLANRLAGVSLPPEVLDALRPPMPDVVLARVERHFTYHLLPTEAICPSVAMAYTMWRLGVRPGWSGHGAVRPWDRADDLLVDDPRSRSQRFADQLRNFRGWARYARAVLGD